MPTINLGESSTQLYLVASGEPLLVRDWLDAARLSLKKNGFDDIQTSATDAGFDWNSLLEESSMLSLFASKKCRIINITSGKPGQQGGKIIQTICEQPPPDTVIVFVIPALDRATKNASWFKRVQQSGEVIELKAINNNQLVDWIMRRAEQKTITIDQQSAAFLAERTEGNLLAADQELEKLILQHNQPTSITFDEIQDSIARSARYNHFGLVDACLAGKAKRANRILNSLKAEGIVTVQLRWALQSTLEQLSVLIQAQVSGRLNSRSWQELRIWQAKQRLYESALKRLSEDQIERLLKSCATLDRINKGQQPGDYADRDWIHLRSMVCYFCGVDSVPGFEQD